MDLHFIVATANIIMIDLLMGGDNAVVIALACRHLPEHQKKQAIIYGTSLAVIVRILMTFIIIFLMKTPFILAFGGLCLLVLSIRLMTSEDETPEMIQGATSIGKAVRTIVIADIIMGLDNVLGIAGVAHGNLLLVIIGLAISVPMIVFGSRLILKALTVMPWLIYIGGGILGYTGAEMILTDKMLMPLFENIPIETFFLSMITMGSCIVIGMMINAYKRRRSAYSS